MNDQSEPPVDSLVRSWLERHEPEPQQLAALRARVLAAAQRENAIEGFAPPRRRSPALRRRLLWGVCGVAAAAFCAMAALYWPQANPPGERPTAAAIPPQARLDPEQALRQARLFARMNEVFSGRLAWIAESDGQVEVGVESGTSNEASARRIAVRLVIVHRAAGEAAWQHTWSMDLVLAGEQSFALKPQGPSGREFSIWTHVLPDGMIAVDASLRFSPSCPEMIYSGVEKPGAAEPVFRWQGDGREYKAFQTVGLLPAEVG